MIVLPQTIINTVHYTIKKTTEKFYKNGVELEKGALITNNRIEKNRELYEKIYNYWMTYPDMFLQLIARSDSHFNLYFYQRIFLRAIMRHGRICTIAPRALIAKRSIKSLN